MAQGAALGMLLAPWGGAAARAQEPTLEYAVKATFLYKFAPFVEWPQGSFASADAPLSICVQGRDPFGPILDKAVAGQRVGPRPVAVRRLAARDPVDGCHVLYLGGAADVPTALGLSAVGAVPVLTVTDAALGDTRGMIHFVVQDNRVRFHVDEAAAARTGIGFSSKLLTLALSVRPRDQGAQR